MANEADGARCFAPGEPNWGSKEEKAMTDRTRERELRERAIARICKHVCQGQMKRTFQCLDCGATTLATVPAPGQTPDAAEFDWKDLYQRTEDALLALRVELGGQDYKTNALDHITSIRRLLTERGGSPARSADLEAIHNAVSKLESQVCRNPDLPSVYKEIVRDAFAAIARLEQPARSVELSEFIALKVWDNWHGPLCTYPADHFATQKEIAIWLAEFAALPGSLPSPAPPPCKFQIGQTVKWRGQVGECRGTIKRITLPENSDYVLWLDIGSGEDFPHGVNDVDI